MTTITNFSISTAEWQVMRVVWTHSHITSRQLIDALQISTDWKEGTIKSLLARLIQKGYLMKDTSHSPFVFSATIDELSAQQQKIQQEFAAICRTKHGAHLLHLVDTAELSQADCQQLITHLQQKIKTAPQSVACHCPKGQCRCQSPSAYHI